MGTARHKTRGSDNRSAHTEWLTPGSGLLRRIAAKHVPAERKPTVIRDPRAGKSPSKLTDDQVRAARNAYDTAPIGALPLDVIKTLAREHGTSYSYMRRLVLGETHRFVI